jgi:hypothetical protein
MRLTKLSLIAAMLIGSSAFAIENTKVSGDARLYYGTQDSDAAGAKTSMFEKNGGYTNFAAHLDLTTDLTKGVSAGVGMQVVTTLGVEHNLVNQVWSNAQTAKGSTGASFAGGAQVDSAIWFDEAWLAGTAFDTTLKIGRQALDTPLAFSETWGVDKNTFEAVVLINQSIADTTLVATYIGKSNGAADDRASTREGGSGSLNDIGATAAGYVAQDGEFSTFGTNGTYCFGVVNNSIKPLTVQAWYYDMVQLAEAYWLQADLKIDGVLAGVQYANTDLDKGANLGSMGVINTDTEDTGAYAFMLGYEMKDVATFKVAMSDVDEGGPLGVANTATGGVATIGGISKLYTELWWNNGHIANPGAESFSITAETNMVGVDWFLGYFDVENDTAAYNEEFNEITLAANKSFGPLDTGLALIYTDEDVSDVTTTDIQITLKYNF